MEERRLSAAIEASTRERGFSPRGTGSNRITPAADEYGYTSALAANLARTGFIRMYSRWCSKSSQSRTR